MNKVHCKIQYFLISVFTVCLFLFNSGCGLETFYVIESPNTTVHEPLYSSIFEEDKYFEFITNERKYEGINFIGTDVYYKIYRNASVMETESQSIKTTSINDDSSSKAANQMIESYHFQALKATGYDEEVLIPYANSNRHVYIRLDDSSPYVAELLVDDSNIYGSSSRVLPARNTPERTSFNFQRAVPKSIPKSDDSDVKYSGTGNENEWYVCMFAVGVAQDANYANVYSNVLYLGSVKLEVK